VKTEKTPIMAIVQRLADITPGSAAGDARAAVVMACYHLYRDSDAILEQRRLAGPHIAEVMQHCTVAAFEIYGEPNSTVMERMDNMLQEGRATQMVRLAGFVRQ
jgi:hypothetical protein